MSNATKILIEKAKEIKKRAEHIYETDLARLDKIKQESLDTYAALMKSAKVVCEHEEDSGEVEDNWGGTHGREYEPERVFRCTICKTVLRREDA